jgi:hypothetical protein
MPGSLAARTHHIERQPHRLLREAKESVSVRRATRPSTADGTGSSSFLHSVGLPFHLAGPASDAKQKWIEVPRLVPNKVRGPGRADEEAASRIQRQNISTSIVPLRHRILRKVPLGSRKSPASSNATLGPPDLRGNTVRMAGCRVELTRPGSLAAGPDPLG